MCEVAPHPLYKSLYHDGKTWRLKTAAKRDSGLCQTAYCRNRARLEYRNRNGKLVWEQHRHCQKCSFRLWRARRPVESAYRSLRQRARKRKIAFTISLELFRELCERSGYLEGRGVSGNALHIDRINPLRGYEFGNLQVITCSENVAKGNRERFLGTAAQAALQARRQDEPIITLLQTAEGYVDCPF